MSDITNKILLTVYYIPLHVTMMVAEVTKVEMNSSDAIVLKHATVLPFIADVIFTVKSH